MPIVYRLWTIECIERRENPARSVTAVNQEDGPERMMTAMQRYMLLLLAAVACISGQDLGAPIQQQANIKTEDGTPFATSPQIIMLRHDCDILDVFGSGLVVFRPHFYADPVSAPPCEARIIAAGYRPVTVTLSDGAVIVLKRLGANEGSGVSMTNLRAPEAARKEYERGEQDLARKKWAEASGHFERAVAGYPQYASAWSELGAALERQGKLAEAEQALNRAIAADPKYIKPYGQLAELLGDQKRWEDSIEVAERAFRLNPIEFPQVYCAHARASLELGRLDEAEKSARQAIENDTQHSVPQAEYFLAQILAAKGDRTGASQHFKKYLKLDKHGEFAGAARELLKKWKD